MAADALSCKGHCNCLTIEARMNTLCDVFRKLGIEMVKEGFLATLEVKSTLSDLIKDAQRNDKGTGRISDKMKKGEALCFTLDKQGVLWFGKRLVVQRWHLRFNIKRILSSRDGSAPDNRII